MTDLESRFHAEWLGLVQPVEGLVVSVPVLADAQCSRRQPLARQQRLAELAPASRIADLAAFLAELLDWTPELYDASAALPDDLSLYVPEGHQTLRPTFALRHLTAPDVTAAPTDDSTPASRAGAAYVALLWDLPPGLPLDRPETATGPWEYPPAAKFDRLLRACRVPIGLLTNRDELRLVYAPHGESSGHITFRVEEEALEARQRILSLAGEEDVRAKEHLLWDANDALAPVRLIGDLVVGAFFAETKDKAREAERKRRQDLVVKWLESRREPPEELLAMQRALRERVPAFHWWVEFPEVFYGERPDPLDGGQVNRVAWMDAFVGNPPFMGGNQVTTTFGESYGAWLLDDYRCAHGNADLCAYFVQRTVVLLGQHGAIGLILTSTVGEGDTRASSLQVVLAAGAKVYNVTRCLLWPGAAYVAVSVVHVAVGEVAASLRCAVLDGREVSVINSRLRGAHERPDPVSLIACTGRSYRGSVVYGSGFFLEPTEALDLLRDPKNTTVVRPCLGGEELNSNPTCSPNRYVIDFGKMSLEESSAWTAPLDLVRTRVKPERDKVNRDVYRRMWWQFAEPQVSLYKAIGELRRYLVLSQVSKHLVVAWGPANVVLTHTLNVLLVENDGAFAAIQSRVHEAWARLLSSSFGTYPQPVLRYVASDCFETFPFPHPEPRTVIPPLEDIGERLYTTRAKYMIDTQQGLTQTYNALKDPRVTEARVVELRRLHEEMDRAVLAAYGWDDLAVPPYGTPTSDGEKKALERFEDEVIDRLFALNAKRAEEERAQAGLRLLRKIKVTILSDRDFV